jgi:hypothetical protein
MHHFRLAGFGATVFLLISGSLATGQERFRASDDPRLPKQPPAAKMGALSDTEIADMLRQLGHQVETVKLESGNSFYRVKISKDGTIMTMDVERSPDGSKVWLAAWFKQLGPNEQIPQDILMKMLDVNATQGPCHFACNAKVRQLYLALPLDNRGLTSNEVQRQIEVLFTVFRNSEPLWNSNKWGTVAN